MERETKKKKTTQTTLGMRTMVLLLPSMDQFLSG